MRKRDKISLLNKMKEKISTKGTYYGLCNAYAYHTRETSLGIIEIHLTKTLGLNKPKKQFDGTWWYDPMKPQLRVRAINRAIKRLQS